MRPAFLFALMLLPGLAPAQSVGGGTNGPTEAPPPRVKTASSGKTSKAAQTAAQLQVALDQLTQSNRDLLDLLRKQQAVLEDMQFDRRLQSRQIQSLEERLGTTLEDNAQLEKKVATLENEAAVRPTVAAAPAPAPPTTDSPPTTNALPVTVAAPVPAPPASYLPDPEPEGSPGNQSWHRVFVLKGTDTRQTELFTIQGRLWRVLWHNQDPPGKRLANTSGLFINAFPRNDTIPQRVCGKVGSGGDSAKLQGPGDYYLKIEASGGTWELAVEDYH